MRFCSCTRRCKQTEREQGEIVEVGKHGMFKGTSHKVLRKGQNGIVMQSKSVGGWGGSLMRGLEGYVSDLVVLNDRTFGHGAGNKHEELVLNIL